MLQQLTNRTSCGDSREWQRILFTGIALISASLAESARPFRKGSMIWIHDEKKRGNPNWGKPLAPAPTVLTAFGKKVARLGLRKSEYATSVTLRRWCDQNRNRVYFPEWLLIEWGMNVWCEHHRCCVMTWREFHGSPNFSVVQRKPCTRKMSDSGRSIPANRNVWPSDEIVGLPTIGISGKSATFPTRRVTQS